MSDGILIKNVRFIEPYRNFDDTVNIIIKDKTIDKIYSPDEAVDVDEINCIIDGTGLIAAPGLIDVHVHFRDPGFTYKEDIHTGALAAAKGGYTSVVLMGNTKPAVDDVDTLNYVLKSGKKEDINIYSVATITKGLKGEKLTDFYELKENGAVGLSDDGIPILDEELLKKAMVLADELNLPISLHEENPKYIVNNGVNAGCVAKELGIGGSDRQAEISLVKRDVEMALETGAILNVQHISTKEAVDIVREAKRKGCNIHAEATPHHFTLTEEAVLKYGTLAKMNPPLRTEEDRQAIIEGLKDGTIDIIATDHAPHSKDEKKRPITEAPSGIIGLETALALGITNLVNDNHLSFMELFDRMVCGPAKLYGFDTSIEEGSYADLVIINPNEEWIVGDFKSKSCNSPFVGCTLKGKVKYTICKGKLVYMD